jgi:hypothetical protein
VISQSYPLFAIHSTTGAVFLVVGWREDVIGYERLPILAPVSEPGGTNMARPDEAKKLIYSSRPQPLYPLPPPAARDTEVIPAVRPASGRLRP